MPSIAARALALYTPPFRYEEGYIYDAKGAKVADDDGDPARVRGWGRISHLPDAAALQDQVGQLMANALSAYWTLRQGHIAPDYYVSSQHGTLKISEEDQSDSAYQWWGVWANPVLYQDGLLTTKLEELDVLIELARQQLTQLQQTAPLPALSDQERHQAAQNALLLSELQGQAIARGYASVGQALAAAPEVVQDPSLPPELTVAPGRQFAPAHCPHDWKSWPVAQTPDNEWCPLCDTRRELPSR